MLALSHRLLVHSVTDRTALSSYLPAIRKFVNWCDDRQLDATDTEGLDELGCAYLSWLCYDAEAHKQAGANFISGMAYLMPERRLPRSARSLAAWVE